MKIFRYSIASLLAVTMLAACGGGADDAGQPEAAQPKATETESSEPEEEQPLEPIAVSMSVLEAPSLSYFVVPLVRELGFDVANGLNLEFLPKPLGTLRTDFAAGTDQLTGAGTALGDGAQLTARGINTAFLFNAFDFWGAVVSEKDAPIETVSGVSGRSLAGTLTSTNYAMFEALAHRAGVNLADLAPENSPPAGLGTLMSAGRVDAVQLWEPAHTNLTSSDPGRFTSLDLAKAWKAEFGQSDIPYIGVVALRSWADANPEAVRRLFAMYKDVAQFIADEPRRAAELIAADTGIDVAVLEDVLNSDRFGMSVYATSDNPAAFETMFRAAVDSGYLEAMPGDEILYGPID